MSSGNRVQDRAGARVAVEIVEAAQHRLAVGDGGRRVAVPGRRLAGHRIRRPRRPARPSRRPGPGRLQPLLDRQLNPAAEVPGLGPGRAVPADAHSIEEPPPPQQIQPIRAQRRRRLPRRQQVAQEHRYRFDDLPVSTDEPIGLALVTGKHQTAGPGHNKAGEVPASLSRFTHAGKLAATPQGNHATCRNSAVGSVNGAFPRSQLCRGGSMQ